MAAQQLARGIWTGFALTERAFGTPNGMDENLRTVDDHLALYTLLAPLPVGSALPINPTPGAGQIFADGTYAVFNADAWKLYSARQGIRAVLSTGTDAWDNTGTGWTQFSVEVSKPAIEAVVAAGGVIVSDAQTAKAAAEAARDGAIVGAALYSDEPTGRAAVTDGKTFNVQGGGAVAAYQYRRISAAQSTLLAVFPSSSAVEEIAQRTVEVTGATGMTPIAVTDKRALIWLEDGLLGALGLTERLTDSVLSPAIDRTESLGSMGWPLVVSGGRALAWVNTDGAIDFLATGPGVIQTLLSRAAERFAPRNLPMGASLPIATDGRTLSRLRSKIAAHRATGTGRLRIAFAGDSWTAQTKIPLAVGAELDAMGIPFSAPGFISVTTGDHFPGESTTRSGWTAEAASGGLPFTHGAGPDGCVMFTSGQAATAAVTAICTEFKIFHRQKGGTWRYRVDAGAWQVVAANNSGTVAAVAITGLADGQHTFDVDTLGNTGTVVITGYHASRSSASGYEYLKLGIGGADASQVLLWTPYIAEHLAHMPPDVLFVILGTNDYRRGVARATFKSALDQLRAAYQSIVPDVGVVFVSPARSGGVAIKPLSEYRDEMYGAATESAVEFLNVHDAFGDYASSSALAQWEDTLHVNPSGARHISGLIKSRFLGV